MLIYGDPTKLPYDVVGVGGCRPDFHEGRWSWKRFECLEEESSSRLWLGRPMAMATGLIAQGSSWRVICSLDSSTIWCVRPMTRMTFTNEDKTNVCGKGSYFHRICHSYVCTTWQNDGRTCEMAFQLPYSTRKRLGKAIYRNLHFGEEARRARQMGRYLHPFVDCPTLKM